MPGLLNIHTSSNHACEYHATDFVLGDRLDGYTESTHMLVGDGSNRLDRGIAHEASECCIVDVRIAKWGVKTDDSTDGHSGRTLIVNANGGSVANVGAVSCASGESVTRNGIGGRQQTVVFRCRDIEFLAWPNSPCHYSIPNALKFASG
ncbi:hypothetical protein VN12_05890 [Pirellula sp. SH-Sr6A]|uniref:hypothetical protein n=1 Tax=Pirellula sp. SH-Sr6A TaxID=1632865 RepID=UPI00078D73D9|nr:hypothetical protein [Pirellula sp. SH-Sr6A]AMV31631.1 hypothetical protein VN12_05890 [Pirellula sp. SH-Sr6A]